MLKIALIVVFALVCIALAAVILLQEGKSAGLTGSISGAAETYWGKNKGRSMEGALEKATVILVALFLILAVILHMRFW